MAGGGRRGLTGGRRAQRHLPGPAHRPTRPPTPPLSLQTAYYSFYLPVACGLLVGGVADDAAYACAKDICLEMGRYFQIQASRGCRVELGC